MTIMYYIAQAETCGLVGIQLLVGTTSNLHSKGVLISVYIVTRPVPPSGGQKRPGNRNRSALQAPQLNAP